MVSAKFTEVYNETRDITQGPSNDELLSLYALAKIAQEIDIASSPKPSFYDLKGKAKHSAWQQQLDNGLTAADAEQQYIELGEKLIKAYKK